MKSSDTGNIAELIEMLRQDAVEKYKEEHGMDSNNRKTPKSTGVHRIICQKCICSGVSGHDRGSR